MPCRNTICAPSRTVLVAVGLAVLFAIYFLFEFPGFLPGKVKYAGMLVTSVLLMGVFLLVCFDGAYVRIVQAVARDPERLARRCLLLIIVGLASLTQFNTAIHFPARVIALPLSIPNIVTWAVLAVIALGLFVKVPRNDTPLCMLALVWGVLLRVLALRLVQFDPESADMLSAIDHACASLLHGINPYSQTYFISATHSFPLVYFPLLWLPYLPFKALAIDIRWFNLVVQVTLFGFVWFLIGRNNRSASRSLLLIVLILLPDMIVSFFYRQMSHYWLLGAVFLWSVWRERWNAALLCIAAMTAMHLTALIGLWTYLIYLWKRKGFRFAAAQGAVVAIVFVLVFLPFSGVGLARFRFLFFDSFRAAAADMGWQRPLTNLAIGGAFEWAGLARAILPLQVGGLLLIGLLYRISRDSAFRTFAGLTAFANAYFVWFSGFAFVYYWFFPLVLVTTLYLIETRERQAVDIGCAEERIVAAGGELQSTTAIG